MRKIMLKNERVKTAYISVEEVHQFQAAIVWHDLRHAGLSTSTAIVLMKGRELEIMSNRPPLRSRGSRSACLGCGGLVGG